MISNYQLAQYWERHEERFQKIVEEVPYQTDGIWYTEALLFCSICDLLGVEQIVESGTARGCSTEIFACYFDFEIVSMDEDKYGAHATTALRLKKYDHVRLIQESSFGLIDQLIAESTASRIGIFLDGPKGAIAVDMKNDLVDRFGEKLSCVGIHDYRDGRHHEEMEATSYVSHKLAFRDRYKYLDLKILEKDQVQHRYMQKWGPGVIVEVLTGSCNAEGDEISRNS